MMRDIENNMKVMVLGANGLVGQKLIKEMNSSYEIIAVSKGAKTFNGEQMVEYHRADITDSARINELLRKIQPGVVVNAAAYTDVDGCEANKEKCWRVNVEGVENITRVARLINSKLIHISTDYVFDGKNGPYSEEHQPSPTTYYGKAKLASENVVIGSKVRYAIIRTNVVYGKAYPAKASFVRWVTDELSAGRKINVVNDQFNNPTFANDLAICILRIIQLDAEGLYNYAGADYVSRFKFAQMIAEKFGYSPNLVYPINTKDLGQIAKRPKNGGLRTEKARDRLGLKILGIDHGLEMMSQETGT